MKRTTLLILISLSLLACDDTEEHLYNLTHGYDVTITSIKLHTFSFVPSEENPTPNLILAIHDEDGVIFQTTDPITALPQDQPSIDMNHQISLVDHQYKLIIYNRLNDQLVTLDYIDFIPSEAKDCDNNKGICDSWQYRNSSVKITTNYS